jgi:hypothetical protein
VRPITVPAGSELVGADREVQRLVPGDARQRPPQRLVHVDVGGSPVVHLAVQVSRQHVEPGIHSAAAGEGLKPQPVAVAGHHRVNGT